MFSFSMMLLMFSSVFFPPEFEALATLPIEITWRVPIPTKIQMSAFIF